MRLTSFLAFIIACATTLNADDLPVNPHTKHPFGVGVKSPAKTSISKISFSTSLSLQPPLMDGESRGSEPEKRAEEKKPVEPKAHEPTDSSRDRVPLLEESLTSSVGSLYDARAIERMMEYKTAESLEEWSVFAKSTWDLGVLGVWKIGQGEIDPVNEESTRASIGLKPLRPIINPEIAFTDRIRLSQFDGLKIFLTDKHIWSIGLKAGAQGGTLALKWRF